MKGENMNQNQNYKVYMHTNLSNGKKYVGITKKPLRERWNNGRGYSYNLKFYKDIVKYGWDEGFSHELIKDNLDYLQARKMENELVEKYDLVKNGYNNSLAQLSDTVLFDYYDFDIFKHTQYSYEVPGDFFAKIPNCFIKVNLQAKHNLHRVFLVLYAEIIRHRTIENVSRISIGSILNQCDYKWTKNRPKVFYEIIKGLCFLRENNYIDFDIEPYLISPDMLLELRIITQNFDVYGNFTKLYYNDLEKIFNAQIKPTKESILTVYLYICSYIGCRPRNPDGTETLPNPQDFPEAFFRSIKHMSKDLGMSKDTIYKCLDFLVKSKNNRDGLLIKREINNVSFEDGQAPNIYVLNQNGYEQEIQWAIQKVGNLNGKEI